MPDKEILSVKIPTDLKRELQAEADKERRSLSNYVTLLLTNRNKAVKAGRMEQPPF